MIARNVIQLAYGIIGIVAYFLVFFAMFGVRKILSRHFILIFSLMAATNMATWANAWVYLKLRRERAFYFYYEWLEGFPLLVNIHSFLVNHFYFAQNIDLLLLTFDRFATILSMVKNTNWWSKYYLPAAFAIHSIVLLIHLVTRLPLSLKIRFNNGAGSYETNEEDYEKINDNLSGNVQLGFGIAVFLACSILNILTLKLIRKLRNTRHRSTEISLIIISFCIFISQFLNVFACFISMFLSFRKVFNISPQLMYEIMFCTLDLFSIGPALYTIILPGPIRMFLVGKIKGYFPSPSNDVYPSSS